MAKRLDNNTQAFLALLRAGLWEKDVRLSPHGDVDFNEIYRLAGEQSVVGLVAAGLEHVIDVKPSKGVALMFVGETIQLEQRNTAMNSFVGELYKKIKDNDIFAVLVKGQGVAQCYERPLWRASGDIDLLLDEENYHKAKALLENSADRTGEEYHAHLHQDYSIGPWEVELHGTFRNGLWKKMDKIIDEVQRFVCQDSQVRVWNNGVCEVLLPSLDNDVIFLFSHILQHYFKGGIGLRQICDWCRLLWNAKGTLSSELLESRLRNMGVMTEWKAFAAMVVDYLEMPIEAMPFYDSEYGAKGNRIFEFILETGNFGRGRDSSYFEKYPYLVRKAISVWKHTCDGFRYMRIFPWDSVKVWCAMISFGLSRAMKGK